MTGFERFVAVDWSGARGARQPGIQVALAEAGNRDCRLVPPSRGGNWSRTDVLDYILSLNDRSTVIGIDFAFSVPWDDEFLASHQVGDVRELWALVEKLCEGEEHLYAGPVWSARHSPFRPYIFHHQSGYRGPHYRRDSLRDVDKIEGKAISVYHMVGPQVGASSFSGMRMLHHLANSQGATVAIWPFDEVDCTKTTIVEIYPSFFYRKAGAKRPTRNDLKASDFAQIDRTLEYYRAERENGAVYQSVDQVDALISAAALRELGDNASFGLPVGRDLDHREGWIFGV